MTLQETSHSRIEANSDLEGAVSHYLNEDHVVLILFLLNFSDDFPLLSYILLNMEQKAIQIEHSEVLASLLFDSSRFSSHIQQHTTFREGENNST